MPSILPPWVRVVPSTPSMLLSIYTWFVSCRKDENKQKEAEIGPFFNMDLKSIKTVTMGNFKVEHHPQQQQQQPPLLVDR